ncbi:MAG: hypothetical protein WC052_05315 [Patescibacteria group bacterium]
MAPKKPVSNDPLLGDQQAEAASVAQAPVAAPTKDAALNYKSKAQIMKEHLAAQPKVMIMIPLDNGEKAGASLVVTLNGYSFQIAKGAMVPVPMQVAEVVQESLKTDFALKSHEHAIGNSEAKLNALN